MPVFSAKAFFRRTLLILCLGASIAGLHAARWMTSYDEAQARAMKENKLMLLNFTGSDWCGWCMRLDAEVFSTPTFESYAENAVILVKLDFPQGIPQSRAEKARNRELMEKYAIRGFPTLLVVDPSGKVLEKMGYRRGGPMFYVETLAKLVERFSGQPQTLAAASTSGPRAAGGVPFAWIVLGGGLLLALGYWVWYSQSTAAVVNWAAQIPPPDTHYAVLWNQRQSYTIRGNQIVISGMEFSFENAQLISEDPLKYHLTSGTEIEFRPM
jgi:thioredoxin-related protein